jgi:hypothetical protein
MGMSQSIIPGQCATTSLWARRQVLSFWHLCAVVGYGAWVAASLMWSPWVVAIGAAAFALFTMVPMFIRNLAIMALLWLLALAGAIFPPLGVLSGGLMILLFLVRIHMMWVHRRPISAGLVLYGSAVALTLESLSVAETYQLDPSGRIKLGATAGVICAVALHQLLAWQYRHGYTAGSALALMGGVPMVILALILPFLKLATDGILAADGAPDGEVPDMVQVHSYVKADGTQVGSYFRAAPGQAAEAEVGSSYDYGVDSSLFGPGVPGPFHGFVEPSGSAPLLNVLRPLVALGLLALAWHRVDHACESRRADTRERDEAARRSEEQRTEELASRSHVLDELAAGSASFVIDCERSPDLKLSRDKACAARSGGKPEKFQACVDLFCVSGGGTGVRLKSEQRGGGGDATFLEIHPLVDGGLLAQARPIAEQLARMLSRVTNPRRSAGISAYPSGGVFSTSIVAKTSDSTASTSSPRASGSVAPSAQISPQSAMHSSQMKTGGKTRSADGCRPPPAISFRTSSSFLPQNEQCRTASTDGAERRARRNVSEAPARRAAYSGLASAASLPPASTATALDTLPSVAASAPAASRLASLVSTVTTSVSPLSASALASSRGATTIGGTYTSGACGYTVVSLPGRPSG